MAITYDAGTNIIQIVAYTEATPCNFTDIYNADKAGTLSLHARTGITGVDADPVAVDIAERPTDYVVLGGASNDLYITIANWNGTTATIQITGTDRDGAAQTEDIVVTANGDYYTTKWFKTITQTQVTAFTGTSFDYDLTQGQWGVVERDCDNQFCFICSLNIGDGTTVTWFKDTNKDIFFKMDTGLSLNTLANSNFQSGVKDASSGGTRDGCSFHSAGTYNMAYVFDYGNIKLYASQFNQNDPGWDALSFKTANIEMLDCNFQSFWTVAFYDTPTSFVALRNKFSDCKVVFDNRAATTLTLSDFTVYDSERAISLYFGGTFNVTNLNVENCDYVVDIAQSGVLNIYDSTLLTGSDIWDRGSGWSISEYYHFDLKVIDKDNTPIDTATVKIWDKDSNLMVDTTTAGNGTISTQTLLRDIYSDSLTPTIKTPHLIKIEKAGYTPYEADFTLEEKTDWTIALQGVLKRNPAMTGGMV